jgi:hypothetical protein
MICFPSTVRGLICHGVVLFSKSMFTGGGSFSGVSFSLSPGRVRTPPWPAPCALRFGAAKGTKLAEAARRGQYFAENRRVREEGRIRTQRPGSDTGKVKLGDLAGRDFHVLVTGLLRDE